MVEFYQTLTGNAYFFIPTIGYQDYGDGEKAVGLIWLNMEIGVRWWN